MVLYNRKLYQGIVFFNLIMLTEKLKTKYQLASKIMNYLNNKSKLKRNNLTKI